MFKKIEVSILVILFTFTSYCALIIGDYWDADYDINLGKDRLKYLFSLGAYKNFNFHLYTELYPGLYNVIAIFITKMFPIKFENEVWRLTHTAFSFLTVIGIYKVTSTLFNKKVAKIAFLLCFINPVFFGHMIMNSKDTIVAFAHVWSTYIFIKYIKNQHIKEKRNRYIILSGLTIGLGMGVRFPFLATLIPLFLYVIICIFFLRDNICKKFSFNKFLFDLGKIFIISYLIAISAWPEAHANIFTAPFNLVMEQINTKTGGLPWMLFNGSFYSTFELPKTYILTNLFYKSPEFILFSYLIFTYFIYSRNNSIFKSSDLLSSKILLVFLILLFPIISFNFLPYRVYDGLRLFLYVMPYFCIIPAIVICFLIENFHLKISKFFSLIIASLFLHYIYIFITVTPYQYIYLNKFVWNFSEAHKKFENDYFGVSLKELAKNISKTNAVDKHNKISIAFCGINHDSAKRELNKIKDFKYEVKDLYSDDFEYVIMTNRIHGGKHSQNVKDIKSCFDVVNGDDVIKVERRGLTISTFRKKL